MKSTKPSASTRGGDLMQEDVNAMVLQLRRKLRNGNLMTFRQWFKEVEELLRLIRRESLFRSYRRPTYH